MSGEVESEPERLERQLNELLQELRVAMPGVQLLFGFLLIAPFNQRFAQVTQAQRGVYLATLLCSALSSAFFIAPGAYHRIMLHHRDRPHLIAMATRMAIAGLAFLALAMTGAVLLVCDFLFDATTTVLATAFVFAAFTWLWFGLAISHRLRDARGAR
jgi:hypothetical protein